MKRLKTPKPLNDRQIEILADGILFECGHEEAVIRPLVLLFDEIARNSFDNAHVENVANAVTRRCYVGTPDADEQEKAFIERARAQWAKALESAA